MTAPCKDCERREVGCHAKCKEYLDYHEYNERMLHKRYIMCICTRMSDTHVKQIRNRRNYRRKFGREI